MPRISFLLLCISYVGVALATDTPPYVNQSPELSKAASRYSDWLIDTGISSPASGWKIDVAGLDAISCVGLSQEIADNLKYHDGIDCAKPKPTVPQYILRLKFTHPEEIWHDADDGWAKLNDTFRNAHGVTLDERLIAKISHLLSIRSQDVRISMQTYCRSWSSQFVGGIVEKLGGWECQMAGASTLITTGISQALKDTKIPSSSHSIGGTAITGELVLQFMDEEFRKKGANVKRLNSDSNYAEAIVERMRGEVIEQQKYWERLQVSIIISKKGDAHELRLLLDGQYAAGINQPPEGVRSFV